MRTIGLAAAISVLLLSIAVRTQDSSQAADHDALRKLKADVLNAINTRNLQGMDNIVHKPFVATVITQDSFTETGPLQTYYDGLFTRNFLRLAQVHMEAEADELSQIYTGTFAVARGSTSERYDLADGRSFDMRGRWTATAIKEDGAWKLLAIHTGTNFLDNPVLGAIEKSTTYVGAGGLGVGLILGFVLSVLIRRWRA